MVKGSLTLINSWMLKFCQKVYLTFMQYVIVKIYRQIILDIFLWEITLICHILIWTNNKQGKRQKVNYVQRKLHNISFFKSPKNAFEMSSKKKSQQYLCFLERVHSYFAFFSYVRPCYYIKAKKSFTVHFPKHTSFMVSWVC